MKFADTELHELGIPSKNLPVLHIESSAHYIVCHCMSEHTYSCRSATDLLQAQRRVHDGVGGITFSSSWIGGRCPKTCPTIGPDPRSGPDLAPSPAPRFGRGSWFSASRTSVLGNIKVWVWRIAFFRSGHHVLGIAARCHATRQQEQTLVLSVNFTRTQLSFVA